jgi:hypothetical protein
MEGRLHFAPFSSDNPPKNVLDIATGTGIWAIEMGDEYPQATIIGNDLSPIQPPIVPPNVSFVVEDAYVPSPELPWLSLDRRPINGSGGLAGYIQY